MTVVKHWDACTAKINVEHDTTL